MAWTDKWTNAIQGDERIPWSLGLIVPEQLIAFGEWQETFREYFRAQGLASSPPEYIELAVRWPYATISMPQYST